jgi:hypothetical protein
MNTHWFNFSVCNTVGYATLAGAASLAAMLIAGPAAAASKNGGGGGSGTIDDCTIQFDVCTKSCVNELDWCQKDCEKKFMVCKYRVQASTASQHAPLTGGVKNEKKPPRLNDMRAPLGGGVFGDGILGTRPGLGTSGPAATGSPMSTGSGAPVSAGGVIR